MRKRPQWAGVLLTTALAAAAIGSHASMAEDAVNGTIWVANRSTAVNTDTIRAFDAATGDVTQEFHMAPGSQPGDLAVAKGKIYVAEERGNSPAVAIVDPVSGDIQRIYTDAGSRPHHVHASAGGNLVAVGLYGTDDVAVIDTHDDALIGRWDTNPDNESGRIHAAVFSNDESTIYLANEAGNQVIAMDPRTGTVFWRLPVPAVHELAISHNQKLLYVSRRGANRVAVVHLDSDVWVQPNTYIDVLALGLPDTSQLSANEHLLTVGLRTSPARLAVVDTGAIVPCVVSGCDSSSVTLVDLDPGGAPTTIGGHQWTSPGGRYRRPRSGYHAHRSRERQWLRKDVEVRRPASRGRPQSSVTASAQPREDGRDAGVRPRVRSSPGPAHQNVRDRLEDARRGPAFVATRQPWLFCGDRTIISVIQGPVPNPPGKHEPVGPVILAQIVPANSAMSLARVDHDPAAFIDSDVRDQRTPFIGREEDEIASPQTPAGGIASLRLADGAPRQVDADLPVGILRQAGTIERAWTFGAPDVRLADQASGNLNGVRRGRGNCEDRKRQRYRVRDS